MAMADKYSVTCDLFTIPYEEGLQLLYAPRVGFLCEANKDVIELLANLGTAENSGFNPEQQKVLDYLVENGVLNGSAEAAVEIKFPEEFTPTRVTIFPTNQCNLRCIYCYASAGESEPMTIDWHYAITAVDTVIRNAKKIGDNFISVGFHGGGEPLFPWTLVKRIVEYAEEESRKNGLRCSFFSATNGLLSEKQLEWIVQHFSDLNISFDGLPHVQDHHRPLPDGKGSFRFIDKTFKYLDAHGFNYGIRSTFSDYNLDLMEESFDFIVENYKPKTIHFEPVFQCGRCKTDEGYRVSLGRFARYFRKIEEKNKDGKVRFTYSGCRVESLSNVFCGVSRDGFSVTPDGYITACFETTSLRDPKSEFFFYGKINDAGEIIIDDVKRKFLLGLTVENLDYCADCFAKWHCAGDCVAKLGHNNLTGERGHERCHLNRQMVKDKLISILNGFENEEFQANKTAL
jgi:uncharacterized protein